MDFMKFDMRAPLSSPANPMNPANIHSGGEFYLETQVPKRDDTYQPPEVNSIWFDIFMVSVVVLSIAGLIVPHVVATTGE